MNTLPCSREGAGNKGRIQKRGIKGKFKALGIGKARGPLRSGGSPTVPIGCLAPLAPPCPGSHPSFPTCCPLSLRNSNLISMYYTVAVTREQGDPSSRPGATVRVTRACAQCTGHSLPRQLLPPRLRASSYFKFRPQMSTSSDFLQRRV